MSTPKTDVVFMIPTASKSVAYEFMMSLLHTDRLLRDHGYNPIIMAVGGDAYLAKVRNHLITGAYDNHPNADTFFFLDDDISWPAEVVLRFLQSHNDKGVVGGVYPKKQDKVDFPWYPLLDKTGNLIIKDGAVRATGIPTGFMMIKRWVIEKMSHLRPRYSDQMAGKPHKMLEIFRTGVLFGDGRFYGEDPAFCKEWIACGGEVWAEPDITFSHHGRKSWTNNLYDEAFEDKSEKYVRLPTVCPPPLTTTQVASLSITSFDPVTLKL